MKEKQEQLVEFMWEDFHRQALIPLEYFVIVINSWTFDGIKDQNKLIPDEYCVSSLHF